MKALNHWRLSALAMLALPCVATAQPVSLPREALGCYRVALGPWKPPLQLGADTVYTKPPERIALRYERGAGPIEREGQLVRPAPGARMSVHNAAYARMASGDSIHFVWTTGFSGLTMTVAARGDSLVGNAQTFWDFGRPTQVAGVILIRDQC